MPLHNDLSGPQFAYLGRFRSPEVVKKGHNLVSMAKAKEILRDGSIRGRPLTPDQRGFFGAIAGGNSRKNK